MGKDDRAMPKNRRFVQGNEYSDGYWVEEEDHHDSGNEYSEGEGWTTTKTTYSDDGKIDKVEKRKGTVND